MMAGILSSDLVNLVGFENLRGFLFNGYRLTKSNFHASKDFVSLKTNYLRNKNTWRKNPLSDFT